MPASLSSLAFALPIALLLALWGLAVRAARRGEAIGAGLLAAAAAVPPILLAAVIASSASRFGDLRVALEGMRFRFDAGAPRTVSVGGDRETDHLVVADLPAGFLTFSSQGNEIRVDLHPDTRAPSDEDGRASRLAVGAVTVRPASRPGWCRVWPFGRCAKPTFWNSVELHPGDEIDVAGAGGLRFRATDPGFDTPSGPGPDLPVRRGPLGVRIGRGLAPELEIYPLADFGSIDIDRPLLGPEGRPLGAFAYRGGGYLRRKVFLTLTEPGVRVIPAAGAAPAAPIGFRPTVATLRPGDALHLALHRIDFEEPERPAAPAGLWAALRAAVGGGDRLHPRSRAQERRSFTARFGRDGVLELAFDSKSFVTIEQSDLAELARRARSDGGEPLLAIAPERFALHAGAGEMLLAFPPLGEPLGAETFCRIKPPGDRSRDRIEVTTHAGVRRYPLGAPFAIGEDSAAIVRVSRLGAPWGALALAAAVAAASALLGAPLRRRLLPFVVLSGIETLLAIRVLIAYQGAYLDPSSADATWNALAALALAPFAIQAALLLAARGERGVRGAATTPVGAGIVALATGAVALARAGSSSLTLALALVAPLGVAWLAARTLLPWLGRLFDRVEGPEETRDDRAAAPASPAPATLLLAIGGLLLIGRLVTLLGLGWKERIDLGVPFAVSIVYLPWALLAIAFAWTRRERADGWLWAWGLLGTLFVAVPFLARDLGSILIFTLPPILLFALPFAARPSVRTALLALPLLLPLVNAALPAAAALVHPLPTPAEAREDLERAEALVARKASIKSNGLRLWSRYAPEELKRVGTTEAEGYLTVMENLRAYATRGPLGEGYLRVPLSEPLRGTHLNDNLSAVHLLAPFGWLGTLALLLLLAGWIVVPLLVAPAGTGALALTEGLDARGAWGLLLLWTLAIAGIYMVSANVELLLFTGKNVYFLAASSLSDVVEGVLFALFALWALDRGRTSLPEPRS